MVEKEKKKKKKKAQTWAQMRAVRWVTRIVMSKTSEGTCAWFNAGRTSGASARNRCYFDHCFILIERFKSILPLKAKYKLSL